MLSKITNNSSIVYQGGSGGFLLYYLLLLNDNDPEIIWPKIYKQFPDSLKTAQSRWKDSEVWPDNCITQPIYLICNPLFCKDMYIINKNLINTTTSILLYTDLNTQLRMSYDKIAYWFTSISKKEFNAPTSDYEYIRSIKLNCAEFREDIVDPIVPQIVKEFKIDKIIKLQDIIRNADQLTEDQQMLIDMWYNLQSKKAQRLLKCI